MGSSKYFLTSIFGLFTVICIFGSSLAGDVVPVLLWDGSDNKSPIVESDDPLSTISQNDFKKILEKKLGGGQPPVLVFLRDNLCVEHLTSHKKELGQLKEFGSLQYIPAVVSPSSVFEKLSHYNRSMVEELDAVYEGQLIITKAPDLDAVPETFKLIRETNLVAVLTGRYCSFSRKKRAIETAPGNETKTFLVETERLLFYADQSPILTMNDSEPISLGELVGNATEEGEGTLTSPLIVKMEFKAGNASEILNIAISFEIVDRGGYYFLERVNMSRDGNLVTSLLNRADIYWPPNFSYHCTENTTFSDKTLGISLTFENIQLQLDTKKFGDAYDCVGFTSIPIWSSLFVTGILTLIMIWGLIMIMDIRTMDRFDDPKGKTITISAQE